MFLRYIWFGVLSMAAAEFQVNVLLRGNVINFFMAMMLYAVLSAIAYAVGRRMVTENADLNFYFIGGAFGLLVIEWWLIGFYPGSGKSGIHAAMFTNWAVVFALPRLFTAKQTEEMAWIRKKVKKTMLHYAVGAPLLALILPIPRGGTIAILMCVYSLVMSFQFVPFLCHSESSRKGMRRFLWFLVAVSIANVLVW